MGVEVDPFGQLGRRVAREHHGADGTRSADAVVGDDAGAGERRHGGGGDQRHIGAAFAESAGAVGGRERQKFGTEVTCVLDAIDEGYRIEIRHGRYAWNCDHHP